MKKTLVLILIMASFACILSGCGTNQDSNVVRVGYFNNITHSQALYMHAKGSLEDRLGQDITVNWTSFNAGPAEVEALFSGDVDIGYIGPVPGIISNVRSKGDITVLSGTSIAGAVLVKRAGSDIQTVEDLAGHTVAIPQITNTQHLCLLKILQDHGLKTIFEGGDVTVTAVENADVKNMMDEGNIDAALVPEPWASILIADGAEILLDYDQIYENGDYPVAVVVVREDYLKEHPDVVAEFLKVHEETTAYIQSNKDEASQIINQELQNATGKSLEPDILKQAFGRISFTTEINKESMKDFGQICLDQGFIPNMPKNLYTDTSTLR